MSMNAAEWIATAIDLLNILVDAPLPSGMTDTINELLNDQPDYVALDAQPAAWEPVGNGVAFEGPCEDELWDAERPIAIWVSDKMLGMEWRDIEWKGKGDYIGAKLPDDIRLCRRVND